MLLQLFSQSKQLRGTVSHLADTLGRLLEFRWNVRWEGGTRLKTWSSASRRCRYGIHSSAVGRVFVEAVVIMNPSTAQDINVTISIADMAGESLGCVLCVCVCLCSFCVYIWPAWQLQSLRLVKKRMCSNEIKVRIAALIVNWNQKTAAG